MLTLDHDSGNGMLVLNAEDVRRAFPMGDAIGVMRQAMAALAEGRVHQPLQVVMRPPELPGMTMYKPAHIAGEPGALGFKALTIFPDNPDNGLEVIQGFVALLDVRIGVPLAFIEGSTVTEIRTAAVSGVATDAMARPDACDLALIGAGVQARSHLLAVSEVRKLDRIRVWNRTPEHAEQLRTWADGLGFDVEVAGSIRDAVDGADVVCMVTGTFDPLLDGEWLSPGVHINAVGAFRAETRELHSNAVARADVVVVDSRAAAMAEAGDLLIPLDEGAISQPFEPPELGEVLLGSAPGRGGRDEITLFKSIGLALEDVASAAFIHDRATAEGIGTEVRFT